MTTRDASSWKYCRVATRDGAATTTLGCSSRRPTPAGKRHATSTTPTGTSRRWSSPVNDHGEPPHATNHKAAPPSPSLRPTVRTRSAEWTASVARSTAARTRPMDHWSSSGSERSSSTDQESSQQSGVAAGSSQQVPTTRSVDWSGQLTRSMVIHSPQPPTHSRTVGWLRRRRVPTRCAIPTMPLGASSRSEPEMTGGPERTALANWWPLRTTARRRPFVMTPTVEPMLSMTSRGRRPSGPSTMETDLWRDLSAQQLRASTGRSPTSSWPTTRPTGGAGRMSTTTAADSFDPRSQATSQPRTSTGSTA